MSLLVLENLKLSLGGKPILNNVSVDFWDGHVHAVVGPNGAGKSTLAATIVGLSGYTDIEGDIKFDGHSIRELGIDQRARKGITLAWQEPARFEGLRIADFIKASAHGNGVDVDAILTQVGLNPDNYRRRAVDKTLSGGERKKVELGSILAMKPKVALLDEPDSGIDIESIERIFDAVRLLKEQGTTVILITHSLAVLNQADHAFLMCHGQVVDKGTVGKIRHYFEDKCIPCDHQNVPELYGLGERP
ncbi:MAG: ABC transporter ATP-binding protein [candidate division Zixibacteria bacterium]|jgi:Fe-S cluster assembly ATP-binding protein|nr:ABC transporter ATP-binding protein [candidate division Zixibacteria bacterium]